MLKIKDEVAIWIPETDDDRMLVQRELSAILASPHFRSSKRYPSLLRYIVEKSLDGQARELKERTLGVEVFDRRPDYDTNADPVVRFSASEVRKRIAQYYHEADDRSDIQIELPVGSYAPEFRIRLDQLDNLDRVLSPGPGEPGENAAPHLVREPADFRGPAEMPKLKQNRRRALKPLIAFFVVVLIFSGFLTYRALKPRPIEQLCGSLLQTPGPIQIVVGGASLELSSPEPPDTNLYNHMVGPYHHVSVATAVSIAQLTNILHQFNRTYTVKEASETSLTDLHARSVILVGALNNVWTLRLTEALRFRFVRGSSPEIVDVQHPERHDWTIEYSKPFTSLTSDYAIIARYHDTSTNGTTLVIAGLGPYGTEAASEYVASPEYLEQMIRQVPGGLAGKNLELVIRTDIIAGEAGPPHLIATSIW